MNAKVYLPLFIPFTLLFSCINPKYELQETAFSEKVVRAQIDYLDNTISTYADVAEIGKEMANENFFLDSEAQEIKTLLSQRKVFTISDQIKLFNHFQSSLKKFGIQELDFLTDSNTILFVTLSDVDFFRLYIKNLMVSRLLNNKLLPKDIWATMASSNNYNIKNGDEFEVNLASVACNRQRIHDWYLVKDGDEPLTSSNVVDTLSRNADCIYTYKTKNYEIGENRLIFINKIPYRDFLLKQEVIFHVK